MTYWGGLDVTGLLLSPQPEVMSADEETDEEDAGTNEGRLHHINIPTKWRV